MNTSCDRLIENTREILAALCSDSSSSKLPALLRTREELLQLLSASISGGAPLDTGSVAELRRLETLVLDAFQRQREVIWHEIQALRRGRNAVAAYRGSSAAVPRYVDRES